MTNTERINRINALKRENVKAAKLGMKIIRRRRRNAMIILNLTKKLNFFLSIFLFIMFAITIDPLYVGNLNCIWFIIASITLFLITIIEDELESKLRNAKR